MTSPCGVVNIRRRDLRRWIDGVQRRLRRRDEFKDTRSRSGASRRCRSCRRSHRHETRCNEQTKDGENLQNPRLSEVFHHAPHPVGGREVKMIQAPVVPTDSEYLRPRLPCQLVDDFINQPQTPFAEPTIRRGQRQDQRRDILGIRRFICQLSGYVRMAFESRTMRTGLRRSERYA